MKDKDHKCVVCPVEIRNFFAVAHNLSVTDPADRCRYAAKLAAFKAAEAQIRPLVDAHFAAIDR